MNDSNGTGDLTLKVATIQMNAQDDKTANVEKALEMIDRAAGEGARLVVLPEVWTYRGNNAGVSEAAEPIPGPMTAQLAERAQRHGIYLHAGTFYESLTGDPRVCNTAVVFDPKGEIVAKYQKVHLFDISLDGIDVYRESASVKPGNEFVTFMLDGVKVGLATCYDLRFPEIFRILALQGAEAVILPAAFLLMTGRDHWEVLLRARAIENGLFMVAANQYGQDSTGTRAYGHSMVVDPWGTVIAAASDAETVVTCRIDLQMVRDVRRQIPCLVNRQPAVYAWPEAGAIVS